MRSTLITYLVDFVVFVFFLCMMMHVHIHPTSVASSRANSTPIMAPNSAVWLSGDVLVGWVLVTSSVPRLWVVVVESRLVKSVKEEAVVEAILDELVGSIIGGCTAHSLALFVDCNWSQA